jgi:hypothetical protein
MPIVPTQFRAITKSLKGEKSITPHLGCRDDVNGLRVLQVIWNEKKKAVPYGTAFVI